MSNNTPDKMLIKSQENLKQAQNDYHGAIDSLNETFSSLSKKNSDSNQAYMMRSAINDIHMLVTNHGQNSAYKLNDIRKGLARTRQLLKDTNLDTVANKNDITVKESILVVKLTNIIEEKTALAKEKTKLFKNTFGS